MDCAHDTALDRSEVVKSLSHRSKAVSCARSSRNNCIFFCKCVVVYVVNDSRKVIACRSRNNYLTSTCLNVSRSLFLRCIETCALKNNVYAKLAPRKVSSVRHFVNNNLLAVNNNVVVLAFTLVEVNSVTLSNIVTLR